MKWTTPHTAAASIVRAAAVTALWGSPWVTEGSRQSARTATFASACSSFCCLHGGLELVGGKSGHALDTTHPLRRIPHREAQQCFGIGRIDDIDEIVVALRVVDRLQ